MKNIFLFLDVDGVLNNEKELIRRTKNKTYPSYTDLKFRSKENLDEFWASEMCWENFQPIIKLFNQIPNLKIVLSTSWRNMHSIEEWNYQFSLIEGWDFEIIDRTPSNVIKDELVEIIGGYKSSSCRGIEIQKWLDKNSDIVDKYCILDDEPDMLISQQNNFIQTDRYLGFTENDIERVIKCLRTE